MTRKVKALVKCPVELSFPDHFSMEYRREGEFAEVILTEEFPDLSEQEFKEANENVGEKWRMLGLRGEVETDLGARTLIIRLKGPAEIILGGLVGELWAHAMSLKPIPKDKQQKILEMIAGSFELIPPEAEEILKEITIKGGG